jgi:hypothetical protein
MAIAISAGTAAAAQVGPLGDAPATSQEMVAGTQACVAAVTAKEVDETKLAAVGWVPPRKTSLPVQILIKGSVQLSFDRKASIPICFIAARLPDPQTFGDVAHDLDAALGVSGAAKAGETGTIYWFPRDHIVQLASKGTASSPAIRIAVGYSPTKD